MPTDEPGAEAMERARVWIEGQPHLSNCWVVVSGAPCDCRGPRISMLARMLEAAVLAEREWCASLLDAAVKEHRDEQAQLGISVCPDSFCEAYGCTTLEAFAAAIRLAAPTPKEG